MIEFKPLDSYPIGTLFNLLVPSYEQLFKKYKIPNEAEMTTEWERFDAEAFTRPQGLGSCVFVTERDGEVVGFGSFDPRKRPHGKVGHNVVLPQFQREGIGTAQLAEILKQLKERGITTVTASTGDHPFFIPAQKMYISAGFKETKHTRVLGKQYQMINYEKNILKISSKVTFWYTSPNE